MSVVCLWDESHLDCHLQILLLVLSFLLFFGCLCLIWRCRQIEVFPSSSGQRRCGELGQQTFTVVPKQQPKPTSTLLDQAKAPGKPKQLASRASAEAEGSPSVAPCPSQKSRASGTSFGRILSAVSQRASKTRVVWKLNLQHAQDWLAGRTTVPPECVQEETLAQSTEPDEDLEVAHESCPQLPRQRSWTVVASQHMAKARKETQYVAAYRSGERVEYFSSTQGKWLLGEVHVKVQRKPPFIYSVTLYRLVQELPHVELEMLRVPFSAGEPCELWSPSEERWVEAEVLNMEASSTPVRQYKVQCQSGDPLVVQASLLRRCFPEGSQVRVYQGADLGFCHARVAGPSEPFQPSKASGAGKEGPLDYQVMVPILKAPKEKAKVPSFSLRLERQLLGTRAATGNTKWKKPLAAKIGPKRGA